GDQSPARIRRRHATQITQPEDVGQRIGGARRRGGHGDRRRLKIDLGIDVDPRRVLEPAVVGDLELDLLEHPGAVVVVLAQVRGGWSVGREAAGMDVRVVMEVHLPVVEKRIARLFGVGRGAGELDRLPDIVERAVRGADDAGRGFGVRGWRPRARVPAAERVPSTWPFLKTSTVPSARARAPNWAPEPNRTGITVPARDQPTAGS